MADFYDTVSDVRQGDEVSLPTVTADESFVLLKVNDDESAGVTLYNLSIDEARDALMGVLIALG